MSRRLSRRRSKGHRRRRGVAARGIHTQGGRGGRAGANLLRRLARLELALLGRWWNHDGWSDVLG